MTDLLCIPPFYTCGHKLNWKTGSEKEGEITQSRNKKLSFMLGGTEIVVFSSVRNFALSYANNWHYGDLYAVPMDGGHFVCGTENITSSSPHSVSEDYKTTSTKLYLLDTRHNSAIGCETVEQITFSYSGSEMCGFKQAWGVYWYPKYKITNAVVTTTNNYFIVVDGVMAVLKTTTTTENVYTEENPLILVYPNPPGQAQPWFNCNDIKEFGFYDYFAADDNEQKIKDGGIDFYFTDQMRMIGKDNISIDQSDAWDRYYTYYLDEPPPETENVSYPGIFVNSTPTGSIMKDPVGRVFYSMTLGGQNFNYLDDGDLLALLPYFAADPKFYPVGVI